MSLEHVSTQTVGCLEKGENKGQTTATTHFIRSSVMPKQRGLQPWDIDLQRRPMAVMMIAPKKQGIGVDGVISPLFPQLGDLLQACLLQCLRQLACKLKKSCWTSAKESQGYLSTHDMIRTCCMFFVLTCFRISHINKYEK